MNDHLSGFVMPLWRALLRDRAARRAIYAIFAATLAVIFMAMAIETAIAFGYLGDSHAFMGLNVDRGGPEFFSYTLTAACVVLLGLCHRRHGGRVFAALIPLYAFILIDDSMQIHEAAGESLAATLDFGALPMLRSVDSGELFVWVLAALLLAGPIVWAMAGRRPGEASILLAFLIAFGALVFCGVVLDMAHQMVRGVPNRLLGWAEDGGEMLSVALATSLAVLFLRDERAVFLSPDPSGAPARAAVR